MKPALLVLPSTVKHKTLIQARRLGKISRLIPAESPTGFQLATFQVKFVAPQHQGRIYRKTTPGSALSAVREGHKLQSNLGLFRFGDKVRFQKIKNGFRFPGHCYPRETTIYPVRFGNVALKGTETNNFPELPNGLFATHGDFYGESVRWIHDIISFRRSHITNGNAAFPIKQTGRPINRV